MSAIVLSGVGWLRMCPWRIFWLQEHLLSQAKGIRPPPIGPRQFSHIPGLGSRWAVIARLYASSLSDCQLPRARTYLGMSATLQHPGQGWSTGGSQEMAVEKQ